MEQAEFQHLVRVSEQDCAADSARYRRAVGWFSALGYAWVLGTALLGLVLLGWALKAGLSGPLRSWMLWVALAGGSLLLSALGALWLRLSPPEGLPVHREQAPQLFEALDRIRDKIQGPPIHELRVTEDFNAAIVQIPRWGLLGASVNYLVVGLPLLYALERRRALAVLAHEYGHLRGGHGSFSAWIYRSRMAWGRLAERMAEDEGLTGAANRRFMAWYHPRFEAKSFALARQDEFEADRVAKRLVGADLMAAALKEIEIKGAWLRQAFWPQHWAQALHHELPLGPMQALAQGLLARPEPHFARQALGRAYKELPRFDDTHPVLRDRLDALSQQPAQPDRGLPPWSQDSAIKLLGAAALPLAEQFDAQWRRRHASAWKAHRRELLRWQDRLTALTTPTALPSRSAAQLLEQAELTRRLQPGSDNRALFEAVLAQQPEHPQALRGLAFAQRDRDRRASLATASQLYAIGPAHQWWAARHMVALLEDPVDDAAALKLWRERLRQASALEDQAWDELWHTEWLDQCELPDLSDFEREDLVQALRDEEGVARAWIAGKRLKTFPWRRCYVLLLDLPGCGPEEAQQRCSDWSRQLPLPGPCIVGAPQMGVDMSRPPAALQALSLD